MSASEPQTAAATEVGPVPTIEPTIHVSTLELFFDLVFVFTLTQLTDVLVHHLDAVGVTRVLLMLGVIWWMYGGYAWLTNAVAPSSNARRTLLLIGMAGFLVMALAIPEAFGASGWAFGVGYMVVNLVHTGLFFRADNRGSALAMRSLAPLNFASALLVLIGGFAPEPFRYVLWAAALALQIVTPYLHRLGWHSIMAGHFVERHGLVVMIAIGESIVAIGVGFAGLPIDAGAVAVAVLGLALAFSLWWAYFAGDDERAEHALDAILQPLRKARVAMRGWGYAHYPMILGVIVLAAGVKKAVGHAVEPLALQPAVALSAGIALFFLGHAWFLRILGIRGVAHRVGVAVAVLAAIPLGQVVAAAQLAALVLITAIGMIVESRTRRRTGTTAVPTFGRIPREDPR
ncbi:low temperature requirement protein A [Actinopolymorpha pittospori]